MRQIKFRAKRLDNGEWVNGSGLLVADNFCVIDRDTEMYVDEKYEWAGNTHFFRVAGAMCDLKTIGQFTGLYDKDGEELYEGDIIRSFDSEGNLIFHHIEYIGASFVAMLKDSFLTCQSTLTQDWLIEFKKTIVGNIHDNKEYLE
jgi:uncharacterized phage protein (TIGR01671 family)